MTKKLTDKEAYELAERSRNIFYFVLDELGFKSVEGTTSVKYEGTSGEMKDSAACLGGIIVRLHEILLPIMYATVQDNSDDLAIMAKFQQRVLTTVECNYQEFLDKVLDGSVNTTVQKKED